MAQQIASRKIPTAYNVTVIDATGTTLGVQIPAVPGSKIQIWGASLTLFTAGSIQFISNVTSLGVFNASVFQIDTPVGRPESDYASPWMETLALGDAVSITLGTSGRLTGIIKWTSNNQ